MTVLNAHPKFVSTVNSMENLYSSARADSAHSFDVTKYEINLTINDQTHFINGFVQANVTVGQQFTGIDYNLIGLTVSEVKVNDVIASFTHLDGILHINYTASPGQQLVTKISYSGTPQLSPVPYFIGMIFSASTCFTISDPDAGRYWWPSYDHPWDKAVVDLHITMRSDWLVGANGLRSSIVDNGNGTKTHNWIGSNPIATYLVCLTAGPYQEINQTAGTIPIQNFVTSAQYNNAVTDFSTLPAILLFFETQFGTYPFEKYGNAVVSMSTYGAMEHQTMTTLGQQYITGNHTGELTIAHELAHQWYGDCLTPLTFKDVWLSEGFATYSELLWTHKKSGWQAACNYANSSFHQSYISWETSVGPQVIYNPAYFDYFNPQSYEKSASVLHMLRLKIGNANFFQLLQNWFTTYHNGNIVTAEFQAMAEQISGMNLDQFFSQWIYQSGIPSVEYTIWSNGDLGRIKIIAKTISPTATRFHLEIPVVLAATPADSIIINANPDGFVNDIPFNTNADLSTLTWDPMHWVLAKQHTAIRIQLNQCLGSNSSIFLTWSAFSSVNPIAGYNIWRKLPAETIWTQANENTVTTLNFTDHAVTNGTMYQYRITAVDEAGYQSVPSGVLSATPQAFPFDWGLLVVDETRDGNGSGISPNDAMVDDFYASALESFDYTSWDCASMGAPSLSTISHYPVMLWHGDDYSQNLIADNLDNLGSYIMGGGKLVISGWKSPSAFTPAFINLFLPGINLIYDNTNVLISAQSDAYPDLAPDPNKLTANWNGILPMIYTFENAQNALYTANLVTTATGNGLPLASRTQNNGTLIVFGFPLYFMQSAGVTSMLQQLLPELGVTSVENNTIVAAQLNLACYPNPFNDKLNLVFNQKVNPLGTINIYNIKGQFVNSINIKTCKTGTGSLQWSPVDVSGQPLPAGMYLLRYKDSNSLITKKLILIN